MSSHGLEMLHRVSYFFLIETVSNDEYKREREEDLRHMHTRAHGRKED